MSINRHILLITLLTITLGLSGCKLSPNVQEPNESILNISYGEYYLKLQTLTERDLAGEVEKLQQSVSKIPTQSPQHDYNLQIKLLLLYSLPKSPIYNSFHAKSLLNKIRKEQDNVSLTTITSNEKALIALLYDQLNQRLLMRNRLLDQQQRHQDKASKQKQLLSEKVNLLEQTIIQLKNIDQTINKREQ